jgi:hypothetical protein
MSEQDDFFNDVERAVAEHRKMNIAPDIHKASDKKGEGREHIGFLSALNELNTLPKEEVQKRWAEIQKRNKRK